MVEHTSYSMAPKDIYIPIPSTIKTTYNKTWTFAVVGQIVPSRQY